MVSSRGERRSDVPLSQPDEIVLEQTGESPTVEVRVWRDGELIHRELCETAEAAADIVDTWSEIDGVECTVDDLSVRHASDAILEPSADVSPDANADREHGPRPSGLDTD